MKTTKTLRLFAGASLGAMSLLGSHAALAAEAAPQAASQAAQVEEVVVTAQKRSERLQDVPASVAVVDVDKLASQGLVRFEDYAAQVPGLSLTSARAGNTQVTLRGITTGPSQSASATAFYVDDAPVGSVNAYTVGSGLTPDLDPSDLANVQVLKGPQGTLYGASAVGGIVKFQTAEPNFAEFGGHLSIGGSSAHDGGDGHAVRALFNVPVVTDKVVLRVSGFDRTDPGYIDNINPNFGGDDVNRTKVRGGRVVLAAKLSDSVRLDLSAMGQDTHAGGSNAEDVTGPGFTPIYGDLEQNRYSTEPQNVYFRLYNARLAADWSGFKFVSSTTYQTIKANSQGDGRLTYGVLLGGLFGIPDLGIRTHQTTDTARFAQEFRLDSTLGKLDYQLGAYFTHEDDANRVPVFDTYSTTTGAAYPLPNIITASILSRYTEYSGFANATYHFTDRFDVLGGVRYSIDHQHYVQDYAGLLVGPERINVGQEDGHIATFLVSPRFRIDPDNMVYARVASGYRPGGPNAVPPPSVFVAPDTFSPDKLTSYEAGYKGAFLDRRLTIDAAVFYTTWKDIQIQTSAGGFNFFVNGGKATSQGAELTARLVPVPGLILGLNSAYTDAKLASPAPLVGGLDGDELPFVPKWSGSLTADWSFPIANGFDGVLSGAVNYVGDRRSDFTGRGGLDVPSYTTVNLKAGVERDGWSLSVYAKNVGDSRGIVVTGSETLVPGANPLSAAVIQPRVIGAQLDVRF